MNTDKALKAFRHMGYKYGEAANGLMIAANDTQLMLLVDVTRRMMEGGTAKSTYNQGERRLIMEGGGWLRFYTVDDVLNGILAGMSVPFIGITQLGLIEGGVDTERTLRAMLRSPDVDAPDYKFIMLENI